MVSIDEDKQIEIGGRLGYDIEEAIRRVRELGNAQAIAQSRRLHSYELGWLDQLEERYRRNPGRPVIHLSDLPGKTAIRETEAGMDILRELWSRMISSFGHQKVKSLGLENIYSHAVARYYEYITIESLRKVRQLTDWSVDCLEPYVTHIKCHKNNWPKEIQPRLPFDFMNEDGAAILAYYTDSKHATCAFTNKNLELHDLMKRAVERVLGKVETKTSTYEDVSETCWSLLLRTLVNIAGIDTNPRQKVADNPPPLWLFVAPTNVICAYLRALWTAEGQARFIRLVQTTVVRELEPYTSKIAVHPKVTTFNHLPSEAQRIIRERPSLLLASATLLHKLLNIDVVLKPSHAYLDYRNEPTVLWTIEITSKPESRKFASLINFDDLTKTKTLEKHFQ